MWKRAKKRAKPDTTRMPGRVTVNPKVCIGAGPDEFPRVPDT